jgi:hypothetical protein
MKEGRKEGNEGLLISLAMLGVALTIAGVIKLAQYLY